MAAVDAARNRIAARRLSDGARAIFDGDYMREQIVQTRRAAYRHWCSKAQERVAGHEHSTSQQLHQSRDYSLEL